MTFMTLSEGLKHEDRELDVRRLATMTHKGMAHFAGTGPLGLTCRECVFWRKTGQWLSSGPRPARCAKFVQLTRKPGPPVPFSAYACRHFQQADQPQPLQRPAPSVFQK
jgi:hypothetical protein